MKDLFNILGNGPVLFIGCHPDDVELGCAGLISRISPKSKIFTLTLSKNQQNSKNPNLISEHYQSLQFLGIKKNHILLGDFTTREFSYSRQEICDFLFEIKQKVKPTCVFVNSSDLHQDHQVSNMECQRTFRDISLIEFNIERSTMYSKPSFFIKLSKQEILHKIKSLKHYNTYKNKNYFQSENILAQSKTMGIKIESPYCEVFNIISLII